MTINKTTEYVVIAIASEDKAWLQAHKEPQGNEEECSQFSLQAYQGFKVRVNWGLTTQKNLKQIKINLKAGIEVTERLVHATSMLEPKSRIVYWEKVW